MTVRIDQQHNTLHIAGNIGFTTVESYLKEMCQLLAQHSNAKVHIDLEQVTHLDGSIVALMISLLRHAKSFGIKLTYTNVPDHILRISQLYGVSKLLPITELGSHKIEGDA